MARTWLNRGSVPAKNAIGTYSDAILKALRRYVPTTFSIGETVSSVAAKSACPLSGLQYLWRLKRCRFNEIDGDDIHDLDPVVLLDALRSSRVNVQRTK
jgi:predicted RNA-binding Zn-ribbon protein involved in translation (DUF1610 family)